MSWDELETRLRQEASKRLDVALCQIGLQPGDNGLHAAGSAGKFFFSPSDLPSRVNVLRQHLPQQAAQIVADAGDILRHHFRLLGYQDVSYGTEIDWHLDAVHGLRAPLIPWFKINFLNFNEVGDHKITWELNRHQHLVTLAKAWLLTGDAAYADEIFAQWYSWQRANPYPQGANWASSLEIAFRSLSWIWVDHLLAGYPKPAGFGDDLVHALALNGRHIEKYLSTYFSPNTHLLGEGVALFFIGALYPRISASPKWKNHGWRIVQEEAVGQVRPDGIYFEQTLHYHVYALDFFLHARQLACRNGLLIPSEFDQVLRKMLAFIRAVSQVGPPDGFGDDDGGRVFDGAWNRSEHMMDPLALGAALFHDHSLACSLTEEAIWLFGESALISSQQPQAPSQLHSQAFTDGGIYVVASSGPHPQQMVIDAGPQGIGHSGHGHADALSVKLSFGGRRWLVDSGTGCYIGPGNERNAFRGTPAHNTLTVDGLDQAQPDGPFAWSAIPKTQVDLYIAGPSFTLFAGSHSGYERLPQPVRHRRFLVQVGSYWLIRDVADGRGSHSLQSSWHFDPELEVMRQGNGFVAAPIHGESCLLLLPALDAGWKSELLCERVSPAYGEIVAAPVVRCTAQVETPAEHAVLLVTVPGSRSADDLGTLVLVNPASVASAATIYRYTRGTVVHHMIFGPAQKGAWSFGPWSSDAAFLYFCVQEQRISHLLFCEGSFVHLRGASLISHDGPLQWLEWTNRDEDQIACSNKEAANNFSASALESEIIS